MIDIYKASSYIFNRYYKEYNTKIDEMKLHKLMYFSQRECLISLGEPMFEAKFIAWKYGPVLIQIRECYRWNDFSSILTKEEENKYLPIFNYIFDNYAVMDSWSLSMLSHGEISWQRARRGLPQEANGDIEIKTEDIALDANRVKLRRFYFNEILPEINGAN